MSKQTIARWESKGGAYWCELVRGTYRRMDPKTGEYYGPELTYYDYRADGAFGSVEANTDSEAIAYMEREVWKGKRFVDIQQPDNNKTPMRRVNFL